MSAGSDRLDLPPPGIDATDPPDFLGGMRAKLPARDRRILERLDVLEDVYVETKRDKVLKETFERFMLAYLTAKRERRKQADIFFVTGPSGAGKTAAVERMLRGHPVLQPERKSYGIVQPYVSVPLTGFIHPRILAETIMDAAGSRVGRVGRGDAWYRLPVELGKRRVGLVHIDEFQHLMPEGGRKDRLEELADAIKGASNSRTHPIAFVLSGLPRIVRLPITDDQVERRNWIVDLPDLQMPRQRNLVIKILRTMSEAVGMDIGNMPDTDMPERMAHAARNRFARVCQGVEAAIRHALHDDPEASKLTKDHFSKAYAERSLARGHNDRNPFLADDWHSLPAGSFLGQKGDDGP